MHSTTPLYTILYFCQKYDKSLSRVLDLQKLLNAALALVCRTICKCVNMQASL